MTWERPLELHGCDGQRLYVHEYRELVLVTGQDFSAGATLLKDADLVKLLRVLADACDYRLEKKEGEA